MPAVLILARSAGVSGLLLDVFLLRGDFTEYAIRFLRGLNRSDHANSTKTYSQSYSHPLEFARTGPVRYCCLILLCQNSVASSRRQSPDLFKTPRKHACCRFQSTLVRMRKRFCKPSVAGSIPATGSLFVKPFDTAV